MRVILPIHGQGMWSTLYGYLALEADLNTIAAMSFYEQTETAGLGDQIQRSDWQAQWQGRQLFDGQGDVRFRVAAVAVSARSAREQKRKKTNNIQKQPMGVWRALHSDACPSLRVIDGQPMAS